MRDADDGLEPGGDGGRNLAIERAPVVGRIRRVAGVPGGLQGRHATPAEHEADGGGTGGSRPREGELRLRALERRRIHDRCAQRARSRRSGGRGSACDGDEGGHCHREAQHPASVRRQSADVVRSGREASFAKVTIAAALPTPIAGRSAIVHDWFQGYHGAERTVEAMRSGLFGTANQPDVFTYFAARDLIPSELAARIVRESRLARLPGVCQRGHGRGRWRYLLPMMPRYFAQLPLDAYELVISSSHAFAVNVRPANAVHLCYCYTPLRYAWLPEVDTRGRRSPSGAALRALRGRLSEIDREASRGPDAYVAISEAVRTRIKRFYGRDARVIHPPVDVEEFDPSQPKEHGHFLWVNRLVPYKHPLAVAEAFRGTPYRLTMLGTGPLEPALRRALPPNVELRGWLPRRELARLFAAASGFVHAGEEDFGISMVEALAAGTPVVALGRGGALDIVRPDADGVLIREPDPDEIRVAVDEVARRRWDASALAAQAQQFSRQRFVAALRLELERLGVS